MADGAAHAAPAAAPAAAAAPSAVLPLATIDQSIGSRILVIMKSNKEIEGTLLGLDEFVNLVLENVVEYDAAPNSDGSKVVEVARRAQLLLNGNNVAMLVPGGRRTD